MCANELGGAAKDLLGREEKRPAEFAWNNRKTIAERLAGPAVYSAGALKMFRNIDRRIHNYKARH